MIEISVISIFLAGIATFFLPCTLPVILGSLALLNPPQQKKLKYQRLYRAILFSIGFIFIYSVLGGLAGLLGGALSDSNIFANTFIIPFLQKASGVLLISFGLIIILPKIIPKRIRSRGRGFHVPSWLNMDKIYAPVLLGAAFAFGWSACVGPIIGGVLTAAANTGTAVKGTLLLSVFSLGLMLPIILFSTVVDFTGNLKVVVFLTKVASIFAGLVFILLGVLFINDSTGWLLDILYTVFPNF